LEDALDEQNVLEDDVINMNGLMPKSNVKKLKSSTRQTYAPSTQASLLDNDGNENFNLRTTEVPNFALND
jgi:hypothetical protein